MGKDYPEMGTVKWRYLRECENDSFSPDRNTSLIAYLNTIFPRDNWIHNKTIPKDIKIKRGLNEACRYQPDYRCEDRSLIVEFDGVHHYLRSSVVYGDRIRDDVFESMGYRVVRIPYFIQLSSEDIEYLFGVKMDKPMCELRYSFFNGEDDGFGIVPSAMCYPGLLRFIEVFRCLPSVTQAIIRVDLQRVRDAFADRNMGAEWVVPPQHQEELLG